MRSTIKIDFVDRGAGMEPVLKVKLEESDDVRDSLMKSFFEKLGGESSWLRVVFGPAPEVGAFLPAQLIDIYPVQPSKLDEEKKEIERRMLQHG